MGLNFIFVFFLYLLWILLTWIIFLMIWSVRVWPKKKARHPPFFSGLSLKESNCIFHFRHKSSSCSHHRFGCRSPLFTNPLWMGHTLCYQLLGYKLCLHNTCAYQKWSGPLSWGCKEATTHIMSLPTCTLGAHSQTFRNNFKKLYLKTAECSNHLYRFLCWLMVFVFHCCWLVWVNSR